MGLIDILDPADPRIEAYRSVRERDLVGRDGLFVAEGEVVIRLLLSGASRFRPVSLLLVPARAEALASRLATLPEEVPVYRAGRDVMDTVAGFPIHRGALALAARGPEPAIDGLLGRPGPALAIGLVGLANHDNVGGIFRNAAAFGADAVLLDATSCDPLYRKAIRVSVGGVLKVPFRRGGGADEMLAAFGAAGFEILGLSPSGDEELDDLAWPARAALLFGTEGEGLPKDLTARIRTVRIAMAPGFDSLNVATSSGIVLARAFAAQHQGGRHALHD